MRNPVHHSVYIVVPTLALFVGSISGAIAANPIDPSMKADDAASTMMQKSEPPISTLKPGQLSARATELAELTGILKVYNQLRQEQDIAKRTPVVAKSLEETIRNQRIVYLHVKLNQYFESANLEIESAIDKLTSGMAALGDRKATLADERARILRRNTFINLISGGLTKIGGYSNALTPASLIPTNVLEIFDGGVQTSLSASTIRQQRDEKRFSKTTPEMLVAFINGNSQTRPEYPQNVWSYLNAKANATDRVSRRATLIERWRATGRLDRGGSKARRGPRLASSVAIKTVYFDDLDDTVTMMADIRSVLSGAQVSLMELSETLREVYDDDPVI